MMARSQLHRLAATAYLLFLSCLVEGAHHDTTATVTSDVTVVATSSVPVPVTTTDFLPPAITPPSTTPAIDPFIPVLSTTTTALPQGGNQQEVLLTVAVQQAVLANLASAFASGPPQAVITLGPPIAAANPTGAAGAGANAPIPTAVAGLGVGAPAPTASAGATLLGAQAGSAEQETTATPQAQARDPAQEGFPGGSPPNTTVDLPLTIVFLLLFIGGAATHITTYRANAKRGHKFLLSDLMFDFCMVRTLTCIFRIAWVFTEARGVVLAAQIFFNGGAAVIFAVNIFLAQRIIRSMHPQIGWSKPFSIITKVMAISVPAIIVMQIVSLIIVFFSVGDMTRLNAFLGVIKFGLSYNLFLVTFPFWSIFLACAVPGPKPEKFGVGNLRVKTSMVMLASALLTTGAIIRTYAFFNPRPQQNNDVLYGKPVFYITQFVMELTVVAMYALLRFDLLFHIPNGASGPGDYAQGSASGDMEKAQYLTREKIEEQIAAYGLPYQILAPSYSKGTVASGVEQQAVYAVFFPHAATNSSIQQDMELANEEQMIPIALPPRPPQRVSRRESFMEVVQRRQSRARPVSYFPAMTESGSF